MERCDAYSMTGNQVLCARELRAVYVKFVALDEKFLNCIGSRDLEILCICIYIYARVVYIYMCVYMYICMYATSYIVRSENFPAGVRFKRR